MPKKKSKELKKKRILHEKPHRDTRGAHKNSTILFILLLIIVFIIVTYVRVVPFLGIESFSPARGGVFISDPDSCYHARRIIYSAQHNMKLPFYDPLLAQPYGDIPIWSPLYDWVSALPSYIISGGSPSDTLVVRTAGILTVVFNIFELLFIALLVYKSMHNRILALLSAFLAGMTKPQLDIANITMMDHNGFTLMLFSLLLYQTWLLCVKETESSSFRDIMFNAIITASLFWAWPGSYIYIAVIVIIELVYVFISKKRWLLDTFAKIYGLSSILVSPLAIIHYTLGGQALQFEYVSFFTVLSLLASGLFFYALSAIFELQAGNKNKRILAKLAISIIGCIVIMVYTFAPLREGIKYAEAQNKWLSSIIESGSIFYLSSVGLKTFTLDNVISYFGYMIFLFPLAFILLIASVIKIPKELYSIVVVCGIAMTFLMLSQAKFAADFSLVQGIVFALFIGACYQKLMHKNHVIIFSAFIISMILCLAPYSKQFSKPGFSPLHIYYNGFAWLKEEAHIPELEINSSPSETSPQRALAGVMAPWHYGHYVQLYSQLPVIADNFGFIYMNNNPWQGFYDMAKFFVTEDENEAIAILKKYKCTYIIVGQPSSFESFPSLLGLDTSLYIDYRIENSSGKKIIKGKAKPKFFNTVGFRLSVMYGSADPSRDGITVKTTALKHFKLIYEMPGFMLGDKSVSASKMKIYTFTEGERLTVPVQNNPSYQLEGSIITNTGTTFLYKQNGNLNDGIIAPYSTTRVRNYPYAHYYKVSVNGTTYEFK